MEAAKLSATGEKDDAQALPARRAIRGEREDHDDTECGGAAAGERRGPETAQSGAQPGRWRRHRGRAARRRRLRAARGCGVAHGAQCTLTGVRSLRRASAKACRRSGASPTTAPLESWMA